LGGHAQVAVALKVHVDDYDQVSKNDGFEQDPLSQRLEAEPGEVEGDRKGGD
jgi:hypothetical protein